jgi:hypothetical protein
LISNLNKEFPELKGKTIVNSIQDKQGRIVGATKGSGFFIIDNDKISYNSEMQLVWKK